MSEELILFKLTRTGSDKTIDSYVSKDNLDITFIDLINNIKQDYQTLGEENNKELDEIINYAFKNYTNIRIGVKNPKDKSFVVYELDKKLKDSIVDYIFEENGEPTVNLMIKGEEKGGLAYNKIFVSNYKKNNPFSLERIITNYK